MLFPSRKRAVRRRPRRSASRSTRGVRRAGGSWLGGLFAEALEPRQLLALTISSDVNSGGVDLTYEDAEQIVVSPNVALNAGVGKITMKAPVIRFSTGTVLTGGDVSLGGTTAIDLQGTAKLNVGGKLSLAATGGSITQAADSVLTVAGAATVAAAEGRISLVGKANDFKAAVSLANSGNNDIAITDANALVLSGVSMGWANGGLSIKTNGAISQTGRIHTGFGQTTIDAGAGSITLPTDGYRYEDDNLFRGPLSLANTGANSIALHSNGTVTLSGVTMSNAAGSLSISGGGAITQSGPITTGTGPVDIISGGLAITLTNAANDFRGPVSLYSADSGGYERFYGKSVSITDANSLTLGAVHIGRPVNPNTQQQEFGVLTVKAHGTISQTQPIDNRAATGWQNYIFDAGDGDIELTNPGNFFFPDVWNLGTVSLVTTGSARVYGQQVTLGTVSVGRDLSVSITRAASWNVEVAGWPALINLGTSTVGRNLSVTVLNTFVYVDNATTNLSWNRVTQSGPLTVGGTTTINSGYTAITLDNAANDFRGAVSITSNYHAKIATSGTLVLGASSLKRGSEYYVDPYKHWSDYIFGYDARWSTTGDIATTLPDLTVTAAHITQTGQLHIAGRLILNLSAPQATVDLSTQANVLSGGYTESDKLVAGVQIINPANVRDFKLRNAQPAHSPTPAALAALADKHKKPDNGLRDGTWFTPETAVIAGLDAATNLRDLVVHYDSAAYVVPTLTMASLRDVDIAATFITQRVGGSIIVPGTATLRATSVFLDNAANDFRGAVKVVAWSYAQINDVNAITLGTVTVGSGGAGNGLTVSAGAVTQVGPMTVAGHATIVAHDAPITLTNADNDFRGAVLLSNTGGYDIAVTDHNALVLDHVSMTPEAGGGLKISTHGAVTQLTTTAAANSIVTGTGASAVDAGAAAITLTNTSNDFRGALSLKNTGQHGIMVRDANALVLGDVSMSADNVHLLSVTAYGTIAQQGAIHTGAGGAYFDASRGTTKSQTGGAIALTNAGNDFRGDVQLWTTGAYSIAINDANSLRLGRVEMEDKAGSLAITTNGALTQTGPIKTGTGTTTIDAGSGPLTLTNAVNDFRGVVNLATLGSASITDARVLALGGLNVGGNLVVRSNAANANLGIGAVVLGLGYGTVGGSMTATATNVGSTGTVAQSGALNIVGGLTINAGTAGISLDNTGHIGGALTLHTAAGATVRDSGVLVLGASTVTGALSLTAAGIAQSAALSVGGGLTMAISKADGDIYLSTQANNVAGGVTIGGTPANVRDFKLHNVNAAAGAIGSLGAATNLRDLTIHYDHAASVLPTLTMPSLRDVDIAATGISQAAGSSMTALGTARFKATTGSIALAMPTNDFRGTVSLWAAYDVEVRDGGDLMLGASYVGHNLKAGAGVWFFGTTGGVTQSGPLTVAGTAEIFATDAPITLNNAENDFQGPVALLNTGAYDVAVTDKNTVVLDRVSMTREDGGGLTVNAHGGVTQTRDIITGTGASSINAGAGPINLSRASNTFGGAVSLVNTGLHSITISDADALTLGTVWMSPDAAGSLVVRANGGSITQNGFIGTGTGAVNFHATGGAITLANPENNFRGHVSLTNSGANNIAIADSGALAVAAITMDDARGSLAITAHGPLTQTGVIRTGTGTTTIDAGSGPITLTNVLNDFRGRVDLATTGSASITDTNALFLGALNVGGNLVVHSNAAHANLGYGRVVLNLGYGTIGGSMTATTTNVGNQGVVDQLGTLNIAGNLTIHAGNCGISLQNYGHVGGAVSLHSGVGATVSDSGRLLLGASTVTGGLSVTAASIAQSGTLAVSGVLGLAVSAAGGDIDLSTHANSFSSHGDRYAGLGVVIEGTPANVRDFKLRNTSAAAGAIGMLGYGYKGNNLVAVTNLRDLTIHYDHAAYVVPSLTMPSLRNVNIVATAISQLAGASMTVSGTATFHATAGAITLTSADNDFRGAVSLTSTGDASIVDANSLVLGKSSIGRAFAATMGARDPFGYNNVLSQTGTVTVHGLTTFMNASRGVSIELPLENMFYTFPPFHYVGLLDVPYNTFLRVHIRDAYSNFIYT